MIDPDGEMVSYHSASGIIQKLPLILPEKLRDSATSSTQDQKDMTFDLSNQTLTIRLMLQNLTVKNPRYLSGSTDTDPYPMNNISGYALVREKK
jgi:hypothetical protein